MSLMRTLAKVAVGVAIAKGVKNLTQKSSGGTGQVAEDGLFRGPNSPGAQTASGETGLEGMMDSILGGAPSSRSQPAPDARSQGGIGDLLEQLAGGAQRGGAQTSGGGLGDLLGSLAGGSSGGLGGLLGGLAGQMGGGGRCQCCRA